MIPHAGLLFKRLHWATARALQLSVPQLHPACRWAGAGRCPTEPWDVLQLVPHTHALDPLPSPLASEWYLCSVWLVSQVRSVLLLHVSKMLHGVQHASDAPTCHNANF